MWILLLMIITSNGEAVVYDQGMYDNMDKCMNILNEMRQELGENKTNFQLTCIHWVGK